MGFELSCTEEIGLHYIHTLRTPSNPAIQQSTMETTIAQNCLVWNVVRQAFLAEDGTAGF